MADLEKSQREIRRWKVLELLDRARPESLALSVLQHTLQVTNDELQRDLFYLRERKLLGLDGDGQATRASLTRTGIDLVEGTVDCEPGIARPATPALDLTRSTRELVRWRLLSILSLSTQYEIDEDTIWRTLTETENHVSPTQQRRELDYLEKRRLVELQRSGASWRAKLTRYGVDLVEYTTDCSPGIARPPKYY